MSNNQRGLAARRVALAAVRRVRTDGAWSNHAVPEAIATLDDARDRALAAHLAYEILRWTGTTAWMLDATLTRARNAVEPDLLDVLELGVIQLLHTRIPARAAIATSVELARSSVPRGRADGAAGFVNGVLRSIDRTRGHWEVDGEAYGELDVTQRLALQSGHPMWIVADLQRQWDDDRVAAILAADNAPPGVTLRANGDRDDLLAELRTSGVDAQPGAHARAIRAPGSDPRQLAVVSDGRATVQDEASLAVVDAASPAIGSTVLDLCAAPGGKATDFAHRIGPDGRVVAVEVHPHRADMIRDAASRQGVAIDVVVDDARTIRFPTPFDIVLVDAPCTGLGTGRRRPEVRWRRQPDDVQSLVATQRALLESARRAVAPGGTVVYSVCTWTADETVGVAAWFDAAAGLTPGVRRQLLPDVDGTDGMFIATWQA